MEILISAVALLVGITTSWWFTRFYYQQDEGSVQIWKTDEIMPLPELRTITLELYKKIFPDQRKQLSELGDIAYADRFVTQDGQVYACIKSDFVTVQYVTLGEIFRVVLCRCPKCESLDVYRLINTEEKYSYEVGCESCGFKVVLVDIFLILAGKRLRKFLLDGRDWDMSYRALRDAISLVVYEDNSSTPSVQVRVKINK